MSAYIIKVSLERTPFPVWRRIIIPDHINFYDLHRILQISFGWDDYHLHDFSFPESSLRIIPKHDTYWDNCAYETDILIDEYLTTYSYIRYIYDFGDEWRHKIVLEKTLPDYSERYATIIKYKGDNFEEDCGGAWSTDMENILPFSETATNSALAKLELPVRRNRNTSILSPKAEKKLANVSKQLKKLFKTYKSVSSQSKPCTPSRMDQNISNVQTFLEELKKSNIDYHSSKQTQYRQLSLFSMDNDSDAFQTDSHEFPYEIYMRDADISSDSILLSLNQTQASDYCRYLQLDTSNARKTADYVHIFSDFMNANPRYYLWLFSKKEWADLETLFKNKAGMLTDIPDTDILIKGMCSGILDCKIINEKHYHRMNITFSTQAGDIFTSLPAKLRTKEYQFLNNNAKIMQTLLLIYSTIELPVFFDKYKLFGGKCEITEFYRLVYWYGRLNEYITTVTRLDSGIAYAAVPYVNIPNIITTFLENLPLERLPYADVDFYTYSDFQKGLDNAYDCLNEYALFLEHTIELKPDDITSIVNSTYQMIINGYTVYDLFVQQLSLQKPSKIADYKMLWLNLIDMYMTIRLPQLKGHCRMELLDKSISLPTCVLSFCPDGIPAEKVTRDTHLYEMEDSIQLMAYNLTYNTDPEKAAKKLCQLLKKCGNDNEELAYLAVDQYIYSSQFVKAKQMLNAIQNNRTQKDPEITSFIEDIDELMSLDDDEDDFLNNCASESWYVPQQPYIRESPKIGRNDPCPCGSGLKYKKCCGKNI